ncbi:MAG: AzlD domain-containing protein [Steroidobacteraceae bacterium]
MTVDSHTLLAILAMAAAAYFCRAGGYWLFSRFEPTPAVRNVLSYLPGTLFVAFVVPGIVAGGAKEWVGAAVAIVAARLTGSLVWPIFLGTAAAWMVWAL